MNLKYVLQAWLSARLLAPGRQNLDGKRSVSVGQQINLMAFFFLFNFGL